MELTIKELHNALDYNPETGIFIWKIRPANCVHLGDVAGRKKIVTYIDIRLFGRIYLAHRLAWFYMYGKWPTKSIDHINGIKIDNRIFNLREVTVAENAQNRHSPNITNTSGCMGVHYHANRWVAQISVNNKRTNLGRFISKEDANIAYKIAKGKFHITNL